MSLARSALRHPWTIIVAVIALSLGARIAIKRMPHDVFPPLGIPTIYVAQPFGGMGPSQMEGYLTYYYEYHFLCITGIGHVESKSIQGATRTMPVEAALPNPGLKLLPGRPLA